MKHIERLFTTTPEAPDLSAGIDEEHVEHVLHSRRYLNMRIRLLKDSIFSVSVANEIKLETIQRGFQTTIERRKELLDQIQQLNKQCQILHEKNQSLKEMNDSRVTINENLDKIYEEQIREEQLKQDEWKQKIEAL